jgi:hypothetical protein
MFRSMLLGHYLEHGRKTDVTLNRNGTLVCACVAGVPTLAGHEIAFSRLFTGNEQQLFAGFVPE